MLPTGSNPRRFYALALAVLALWGILFQLGAILRPEAFAGVRNSWNLWWAVHLALLWQMVWPKSATWVFCVAISWIEIVIRVARIALFLIQPDWSLLPAAWFGQQAAALLLFLLLARHLHVSPAGKALRDLD